MSDSSKSSIRTYWAKLRTSVHPDDEPIFKLHPRHSFDLRFPPPAFIGNVDSAPIVILMSNGGYKPGITEAEFPDDNSVIQYRRFICGELPALPSLLASYYSRGQVGDWIQAGKAVIVNAVPYRSPRLSDKNEKYNRDVAEQLPSLVAHRKWLMNEVLPEAKLFRRFLFVHRNGWWKIPEHYAEPCILFSDSARAEPNRQAPDRYRLDQAQSWLNGIGRV